MRVVEVTLSEDYRHAYVVLRPSWLGRLFRHPTRIVELQRMSCVTRGMPMDLDWVCRLTRRRIREIEHGQKILGALTARPVGAAREVPYLPPMRVHR